MSCSLVLWTQGKIQREHVIYNSRGANKINVIRRYSLWFDRQKFSTSCPESNAVGLQLGHTRDDISDWRWWWFRVVESINTCRAKQNSVQWSFEYVNVRLYRQSFINRSVCASISRKFDIVDNTDHSQCMAWFLSRVVSFRWDQMMYPRWLSFPHSLGTNFQSELSTDIVVENVGIKRSTSLVKCR